MIRWSSIALVLLIGCGSGTSPAESADDFADDEAVGPESTDAPASEPAAAGADSPSGDDVTAGSDDVRQVLQLVLDDEALEPYLKLGEPGRFPLRVAGDNVPEGLVKATKPVEVVTGADGEKAVLVFDEISVSGSEASVRYHYHVEDIKGSARLKKRDGRWELTNSRVTQRR
jgi:hypothetical protein